MLPSIFVLQTGLTLHNPLTVYGRNPICGETGHRVEAHCVLIKVSLAHFPTLPLGVAVLSIQECMHTARIIQHHNTLDELNAWIRARKERCSVCFYTSITTVRALALECGSAR